MSTLIGTRLDAEGHVVEPGQWDEALARPRDVPSTDDHGFVIRLMRDDHRQHEIGADARQPIWHLEQRHRGDGSKRIFELFPYGCVAQACRIAGMKGTRAWSTG